MRNIRIENSEKVYFTSDLHLGHANIIQLCNRPFCSIDDMDNALIENWNSVINGDDTVFVLGDFCWKLSDKKIKDYLASLKGNKIFIRGNHDHNIKHFSVLYEGFIEIEVADTDVTQFGGWRKITLCHYPMLSWNQSHRGAWQFFGHWHTLPNIKQTTRLSIEEKNYIKEEFVLMDMIRKTQYDVGVDLNGFKPISYGDIKKKIIGK